jgi:thiol-disulfide isomerase/thioredoxin
MIVITKKDKKLLLLIASFFIAFWFIFISISSISARISFRDSDLNNLFSGSSKEWLNVSRDLRMGDLKNRIVLLDFWTYACVNCMHMIPEIKKLEEEFGDKLTVVGVHSGKFDNEKEIENIKSAVLKFDINHPVVNDNDSSIWKKFNVSSWPTLILLDPRGNIQKVYIGEGNGVKIHSDIKKLIKKYNPKITRSPLPILLEKNKIVDHVLQFPSKVAFAKNFSYKNIARTNALVVSSTASNKIIIAKLTGEIILEIGSQDGGFEDGKIEDAKFNLPRGLLYRNNVLYVADTGNHALRKIDFANNKVSTIAGDTTRGDIISLTNSAKKTKLASPWDLDFFPDRNNIIIANAGTHQLLKYNISKGVISPFAGSGKEGIADGKFPNNSLAQTGGLSSFGGKLYFVDSETSSLRVADSSGNIKTLIGKGLFDFGRKNGEVDKALMQHPVGVTADDTGIYIADTLNHIIRKYNFSTKKISDYSGSVQGSEVGPKKKTSYNAPEDIISILDKFYIADTNNNRILVLDRKDRTSEILDLIPQLKMPKDGLLEYLPNLKKIPSSYVKNGIRIKLVFDLKKGWKINQQAPSFFNLVQIENNKTATLITRYDSSAIEHREVKLPKLSSKYSYYLQGTVYYCEDKPNALCLIRSYEQKLDVGKLGTEEIKIEFIY